MLRRLVLAALAVGAIFAFEPPLVIFYKDVKRYNAMRQMSGDSPFSSEAFKMAGNLISQVRAGRQRGVRDLLGSLTHDAARYIAMRNM